MRPSATVSCTCTGPHRVEVTLPVTLAGDTAAPAGELDEAPVVGLGWVVVDPSVTAGGAVVPVELVVPVGLVVPPVGFGDPPLIGATAELSGAAAAREDVEV